MHGLRAELFYFLCVYVSLVLDANLPMEFKKIASNDLSVLVIFAGILTHPELKKGADKSLKEHKKLLHYPVTSAAIMEAMYSMVFKKPLNRYSENTLAIARRFIIETNNLRQALSDVRCRSRS